MAEAGARAAAELAGARHQTAREAFDARIAGLHHLASTRAIPGVFSLPPAEVAAGLAPPLVEGLTIEEHLRRAAKAAVGPRLLAARERQEARQQRWEGVQQQEQQQEKERQGRQEQRRRQGQEQALATDSSRPLAGVLPASMQQQSQQRRPPPPPAVPATTLRQAAPYGAAAEAAALARRVDRAAQGALHAHVFVPPSAKINAAFIDGATIRSAGGGCGSSGGAGVITRGGGGCSGGGGGGGGAGAGAGHAAAATARPQFDVTSARRPFFDAGLRQGY